MRRNASCQPVRAAVGALLVAGILCALTGAPARAALLRADQILGEDQLQPGMRGYAKTVFHGTRVERFGITVLGVLEKIDFGANLILIRIDNGPVVSEHLGIVAGMSGSPVYVKDRLVGAIAFAFPFAREPVAGVTPIRQMLEAFEPGSAPARQVAEGTLRPRDGALRIAGRPVSRVLVAIAPTTASDPATMCLTPIATPVMVSGASREGLRRLGDLLRRHHLSVVAGPGAGAHPEPAPPLEPGAAVGAQLISGDLDATAIGTVTAVIGDRVIAFGHPFTELGAVDIPLTGAYVHAIMPSYEASFKLASPTRAVGHFTQDRAWCIGGVTGSLAHTIAAEFTMRDLDRGDTRHYRIQVLRQRELTPELLFDSALSALFSLGSSLDGTIDSSLRLQPDGMDPVVIRSTFVPPQRASLLSMLFEGDTFSMLPLGDMMRALDALENNPFGPVALQSLSLEASVTSARRSAEIERAYADRSQVRPGDAVRVGVVIQPFGEPHTERELTLRVPDRAPPGRLRISIAGGGSLRRQEERLGLRRPDPRTAEEFIRDLADQPSPMELVADVVSATSGVTLAGRRLDDLPPNVISVLTGAPMLGARITADSDRVRTAVPWPLSGAKTISLTVETDQKEKAGRPPSPSGMGLFGEEEDLGTLFEGLFRFGGEMSGLRVPLSLAEPALSEAKGRGQGEGAASARSTSAAPRLMRPAATGDESDTAQDQGDEAAMPSWSEVESLSDQQVEEIGSGDLGAATGGKRSAGLARAPAVWEQNSEKDFAAGKCAGAAVTSDGKVIPAPRARALWRNTKGLLWCQASDGKGNLYLGSWGEGAIVRLGGDGKAEVIGQSPDVAITALTFDAQGALLAAGAPSGAIYRVAGGKAQQWCQLDDPYIWALALGGDGRVYAATGPRGRVYAVDAAGRAQVALETPDRHVAALAVDPAGVIYAATTPRGKVYRLGLDGRAEAVFEAPDSAVGCLAADRAGNLYVGTSPKASVYRISPASGGQAPQGAASVIFESKDQRISALQADGDAIYAATKGAKAHLYRISPASGGQASPQSAATLAEFDGEPVSLTSDGERGLTALLAPSSEVMRLGAAPEAGGQFLSSVLDAGGVADWGALTWGSEPAGDASVALRTRSGNTAYPDGTWSAWSGAAAAGGKVASPAGRYLQYRVDFAAGSKAALQWVKVFRLNRNLPPEVQISAPAGGATWSGSQDIEWKAKDADGDTLTYEVFISADGGPTWKQLQVASEQKEQPATGKKGAPKIPAPKVSPRVMKIVVPGDTNSSSEGGEDPQQLLERLRKAAEAKGGGGVEAETEEPTVQKQPEKELKSKSLSWDTTKEKDGIYLIKVVASDAAANPADPKTAEAISEPVTVDNTPPTLVLTGPLGRLREPEFAYLCRDATSYVASAEYRVDQGKWIAAAAADRVFDAPEEQILIKPGNVPFGAHTLEIRVRDGAGNEKTLQIRYLRRRT